MVYFTLLNVILNDKNKICGFEQLVLKCLKNNNMLVSIKIMCDAAVQMGHIIMVSDIITR